MKIREILRLWHEYNDDYIYIQRNPYLRKQMHYDPGVKFMRRVWFVIIFLLMLAVPVLTLLLK